MSLATILLLYLADRDALASVKRHTCSAWRKEPAIRVWKGKSLRLLSTLPIDWQWETHPRLIVLRSQFKSELPPCHGGKWYQRALPLVRRGLLAKYLAGVSVTTECLSGGKWLLYTTALWPWPSWSDIYHKDTSDNLLFWSIFPKTCIIMKKYATTGRMHIPGTTWTYQWFLRSKSINALVNMHYVKNVHAITVVDTLISSLLQPGIAFISACLMQWILQDLVGDIKT